MSFSRYFKLATALLFLTADISFSASSGKIRFATGDAVMTRNSEKSLIVGDTTKAEFKGLKKGKKTVKQGDNIRTYMESQVIIALPDGSSFSIQENTDLTIERLSFEDGQNLFTTTINNGKMGFDVQKQGTASKFKFKTGTATAAIRGTAGIFGSSPKVKLIASLKNGEINLEFGGKQYSVKEGQTALSINDKIIVFDLKSSGDDKFLTDIESALSDSSIAGNLDSLTKALQKMDGDFQTKLDELKKSISCSIAPLPDTVFVPKVDVTVECSAGAMVAIDDDPVQSNGGVLTLPFSWEATSVGLKKIGIRCYTDKINYFNCAETSVFYVKPQDSSKQTDKHQPLTITTSSPLEVCNPASATIDGTFDPRDSSATLIVSVGNASSSNLVKMSVNGNFSYTIPITDKIGNWNETQAKVIYKSSLYGDDKASLDLKINKSCKDVNTIKPKVTYQGYDSLTCSMQALFENITDDNAIYTISKDNSTTREIALTQNQSVSIELSKGRHEYEIEVTDQAGNSSRFSRTLGCYPIITDAKVSIEGRPIERLRVPPPPMGIKNSFYKVMKFSVTGLPANNPDYIKQIVISQPGKPNITLRGSDLESNHFNQQVELSRGTSPTIDVTVTLKSGQILNDQKTYEVR
ncbi:FecR domain-containing protein [uncultured Fibrobacter sp.]|uniref:FecR family protein n=1 Tax=uncultured Fibrobacter sp. TaxID=261512 RepID=UPI0026369DF9|nr:FecR domain-containing protein [uncultured Fibrobacter sp.]